MSFISWGNSGYLRFSGRWPFGRSAGRFLAPIAQSGPFWAQKCCFLAGNQFLVDSLKKNCYHHDGTPKRQRFCVDRLAGWSPGRHQGPFMGQKWPENLIFLRYTYKIPFFGLRRTWLNEIITSTYPEVTLDTFSFPEGGRLAARQAVVWPQLPKMALFGTKNAYYSIVSHGIVWYCMVLLCILWYCIVLHVIALYRMVLQGIVLLASVRGLYLARHLPTLYYIQHHPQ